MDLKNISKLTDNQLIELYRNPSIASEIKDVILKEITFRDLKELESEKPKNNIEFTQNQKLIILLLSPLLIPAIVLFIIFHHKFLKIWSRKKYKQFWNLTTLGIGLYIIILFILLTFR